MSVSVTASLETSSRQSLSENPKESAPVLSLKNKQIAWKCARSAALTAHNRDDVSPQGQTKSRGMGKTNSRARAFYDFPILVAPRKMKQKSKGKECPTQCPTLS